MEWEKMLWERILNCMSLLYGNCLKTMMENVLDKGRKKTFLKLQPKQQQHKLLIVCLADKGNFIFSGTQRENERKFLRIVHNFPCHSEWGRKKNGKERTKKRRRRRKKMDIGKLFNCYTDVNSNFKQFLGIILLIQSIYLSISLFHINIYIFVNNVWNVLLLLLLTTGCCWYLKHTFFLVLSLVLFFFFFSFVG